MTVDARDAKWVLRKAVNALALPPDEQLALEGIAYGSVGEDLFEDFAVAQDVIRPFIASLTESQATSLAELERARAALSREDFEDREPNIMSRPHWCAVRKSALDVLAAFNWPPVSPGLVGTSLPEPLIEP